MANKPDFAQTALKIVEQATQAKLTEEIDAPSQDQVSKFMREMGRRGGVKGGHSRAAKMTDQERSEAASKAARARWGKQTTKD